MHGLRPLLDAQRDAASASGQPTAAEREDRLDRLIEAVAANADRLVAALDRDYGHRAPVQSLATDVVATISALRHSRRHLRRWMRPVRHAAGAALRVAGVRSRIDYRPLGVVGIVSPWNFPVTLSLHPLGQAFAAGNRAMLKVSEVTEATGKELAAILGDAFDPAELAVVTGGPAVAEEFCRLPFDHLFFTGSTAVGRRVLEAAADNLVPVTLELGGQCPVVVGPDADLSHVTRSLVFGKTLNAGQFCVAPDHVYVPAGCERAFVEAARAAARTLYPDGYGDEYTAIVNGHHYARLVAHLRDARQKGAEVIPLGADEPELGHHRLAPTLLLGADDTMTVTAAEVFGPLLPVHAYTVIGDVIARVNARPAPLAAYYFGGSGPERQRFVDRTVSGGVTVNDIMVHVGLERLPFGGVGASGMGAYHGRAGFETFSHARAVVEGPRRPLTRFAHPPYPRAALRLLRWHVGHQAKAARRRRSTP